MSCDLPARSGRGQVAIRTSKREGTRNHGCPFTRTRETTLAHLASFFGTHCKTGSFVPVVVFGKTISFERRGANQLLRAAMRAYAVPYDVHRIESYNCRMTTSGQSWSAHAWAAAVDINPEQNPFTSGKLKTDMPKAFIKAFTDEGFGWGGNWSKSKDAMHFSLSPNEGGKPKPEPFDRKLQKAAIALWLERNNGVNIEPVPPSRKSRASRRLPSAASTSTASTTRARSTRRCSRSSSG